MLGGVPVLREERAGDDGAVLGVADGAGLLPRVVVDEVAAVGRHAQLQAGVLVALEVEAGVGVAGVAGAVREPGQVRGRVVAGHAGRVRVADLVVAESAQHVHVRVVVEAELGSVHHVQREGHLDAGERALDAEGSGDDLLRVVHGAVAVRDVEQVQVLADGVSDDGQVVEHLVVSPSERVVLEVAVDRARGAERAVDLVTPGAVGAGQAHRHECRDRAGHAVGAVDEFTLGALDELGDSVPVLLVVGRSQAVECRLQLVEGDGNATSELRDGGLADTRHWTSLQTVMRRNT